MLIQTNSGEKEMKKSKEFYKEFINQLVLTLNSRARPYSDVKELEKDYSYDTGFNPQLVAMEFGFPTFDAFLKSDFMRAHVQITLDGDGNALFLPHENPAFKHIRDHQLFSQRYVEEKKERVEHEKYARAMQPEFHGKVLEGKRRLLELAYEMGAESKDINYQHLQAEYLKKYDSMLGPEELRKFFSRSNAAKILINYCNEEFVLSKDDTMSGLIFLRLKRPYKELMEMHEKMVNLQKEYEARKNAQEKVRPVPSQKNIGTRTKKKKVPLSERQLHLVPILPQVSEDLFKEISGIDALEVDCQRPSTLSHPPNVKDGKQISWDFPDLHGSEPAVVKNCQGEYFEDEELPAYISWNAIENPQRFAPIFQKDDGGCTSSNVCKSFEEEYGGKANRKVQNTLRHLHQVHRRSSSSSSSEHEAASECSNKKVIRKTVEQRNMSTCKQSSTPNSDSEKVNILQQPSNPLCNKDEMVVNKDNFFLSPAAVEQDVKNKRAISDGPLPANNASLPLMAGHNTWRPEDSSDEEQRRVSKPIVMPSPEINISHSSSDRGFDRAEALRDFIHAVVHLRSPEFVDLKFLLETLVVLHPNYEDVLESLSLRQFIKRNCSNAVMGMYKDSVIIGWRE